jgi:hypothetical protein
VVLRFGPDDKLAEVRIRYETRTPRSKDAQKPLLDVLKKSAGEPETVDAPWANVWADQAAAKAATVCYRWADDRTILTYQRDSTGFEIVLTDWPITLPKAAQHKPLELCAPGVDDCRLGDSRDDLLKRWKINRPQTTADGGVVLFPPVRSAYDLVLAYCEAGKVVRLLARHRTLPSKAEDHTADLQRVWYADVDRLGVVRRLLQVRTSDEEGMATTGFGWNDDRTRIVTFVGKDGDAQRLFTEWRTLPLAIAQAPTAK